MRLIRTIQSAVLATSLAGALAAAASVAAAQPAGTCTAAPNHSRQNCTILSANCGAGQLPNPGVYPACNCVCQAMPAKPKPSGQSMAPPAPQTPGKAPDKKPG
ncbi:hypothetical protein [Phenylobacterium sp.]|uniref:hypothetical protein n=1 Tax=Phenylobacterium sp. TaxID=1871053 RepID=UPI00391A2FF4